MQRHMPELRISARTATRLDRTPQGETFTDIVIETFQLNGRLLAAGDALTKDLGLSSARWQVLGAADGEKRTVADIARRMGLRRQSVQRTVNSLREDDFLVLQTNPNHRRAKLVELTERGRSALDETFRRQAEWANDVGAGLSPDEMKGALQLLATLKARVERSNPGR